VAHDEGRRCLCVTEHRPRPDELHAHHIVPLYADGPDTEENVVWVCPTTHASIHELLRAWERYEGEPPWSVRRYYGPYTRRYAELGWQGMQEIKQRP
jgi:hypothetical protein